jgi:multidrug efflux pump subunit AcrA (membrane-fusion protein)
MSDPRFTDPRLSDPVLRRDEGVGGTWGWIAGLAILALIAFLLIAGWNSNPNSANNNASPATTGTATRQMSPPTTTGSGRTSPQPLTPAAPQPSPAPSRQ